MDSRVRFVALSILVSIGCQTSNTSSDESEASTQADTSDGSGETSASATGDGDAGTEGTSETGDGDADSSESGGDGDAGDGDTGDGDTGDGDSGDGDSGDGDGEAGDGDGDGDPSVCPDPFYEDYPKSDPAPYVACDLPSPCDTATFGSSNHDWGDPNPVNNPAALDCIVAALAAGTPGNYTLDADTYITGHTYTIRRYAGNWAERRLDAWEDSTAWFDQSPLEAVPDYDFSACTGLAGYSETRSCIAQGFTACTVWDEDSALCP